MAAVEWFNKHSNNKNSVPSLTKLKSTMTKPNVSHESASCDDNKKLSNSKGLPSLEQLNFMHDRLVDSASIQCLRFQYK